MDLRKLKTILDLFEHSTVSELEILEGEDKVRLVKHAPPGGAPAPVPAVAPAPAAPADPGGEAPAQEASAPTEPELEAIEGEVLRSPMVGTFYRASSPDSDPYVRVGDQVQKGQTVCLIEAMKLMNEVAAPCDGTVKKILVENASPVGFDDPLVVIA